MLSKRQIASRITGIRTRTSTLRGDIQTLVCNIAGHVLQHGDVTMYDRLFDAASGMNRKLLAKWITDHGLATMDTKTGQFKLAKSAKKARAAEYPQASDYVDHLLAEAPKWWIDEAKAADVAKELDVAKLVEQLATRVENAVKAGKVIKMDKSAFKSAENHLEKAVANL